MTEQRYVANELTHFVGRGLSERDQYELLKTILTDGLLKCDPQNRFGMDAQFGEAARVGTQHPGYLLNMDYALERQDVYQPAYQPLVVCFCDIPLEDLRIHMKKYSRFGLSFRKSFLIRQGANPVFYVARSSPAIGGQPRADYFRQEVERFRKLLFLLEEDALTEKMMLQKFFGYHVFGFVKVFDDSVSKSHPDNFYMEREWRVLGDVSFSLEDVYRVILPEDYVGRFFDDLPRYRGQVHYAPR